MILYLGGGEYEKAEEDAGDVREWNSLFTEANTGS
jgi:hypothetical protein